MTKEPIMIDDVDVSDCIHRRIKNEYFTYCNAYSSKVFDFDCSDFPNCYYKQHKRKEQECERLKEGLTIIDDEALVVEITEQQFEEYNQLKGELEKYKQALQEIKEIAKGYKPYKVCGDYNNNCEPINEILQKCEVFNG